MTIWDTKKQQRLESGRNGDAPDDYVTAIHEASHAVVANAVGFTVTRVTERYTDRLEPRSWSTSDCRWYATVVKLAGLCAVAKLHDKSEGHAVSGMILKTLECFYDDFYGVFRSHDQKLPELAPAKCETRALYLGQAIRDAMEIVDARWSDIEKLAKALMNSGKNWELKGDQLEAFLPGRGKTG